MYKSLLPARAGVLVFVASVVSLLVLSSLLATGGAFAQESPDDDRLTILITASRFAETVDETLAPVTVITRKEIEEKQASTVEEVLRSVPGVTFGNNGGVGKQTSLFLRGTESDHVLVLIDGVKVGSPTLGLVQFEHLPLDQIEKIEVVRGPRSSLYGSEAIGGVIQIFTRKGTKETRPRLAVSAGSHNTRKLDAGISGGRGDAWYNIGASVEKTDGFDSCVNTGTSGCFAADQPDDDGYDNESVSLRGGVSLSDALTIEANFLNSDIENEFDGGAFGGNYADRSTQVAGVTATMQASERWRSLLSLGRSKDESDNFHNGNFLNAITSTREQIGWQNEFRMGDNRVVTGIDYTDEEVEAAYDADRDNTGIFTLLRTAAGGNDVELSVRHDDNEQFGGATTGSIGLGRDLDDGKRITASYGTAFKTPNFTSLYGFGANPNLDPEKSRSFDVGLSQTTDKGRVSINLFHTKIEDLIAYFDPDGFGGPTPGINRNIDEVKIIGVEVAGDVRVGDWDVDASVTLQNPKDTSGRANDGNLLARRPKRTVNVDVARQFGKYRFGANLFSRGNTYNDYGNTTKLDGFTTLNLRGEARLHRHWRLLVKVNNVTDREYETVVGYPQDGANFLATLRYIH